MKEPLKEVEPSREKLLKDSHCREEWDPVPLLLLGCHEAGSFAPLYALIRTYCLATAAGLWAETPHMMRQIKACLLLSQHQCTIHEVYVDTDAQSQPVPLA